MDTEAKDRFGEVITGAIRAILVSLFVCMCNGAQGQKAGVTTSGEVIFGGPPSIQAREALQERIDQQSESGIKLVSFDSRKTKYVEGDEPHFEFGFEAQIEFTKSCEWVSRSNDENLTFKILKPGEKIMPGGSSDVIDIPTIGEDYIVFGSIWFTTDTNGWHASGFSRSEDPKPTSEVWSNRCFTNLRWISAAFAQYEIEHDGHKPFDISTNSGGTLELCVRDDAGFDKDAASHFQAMSDFFSSPGFLVCPADPTKCAAKDFRLLKSTNVTYQLHTGSKSNDEAYSREVLVVCPIHGLVLYSDGNIERSAARP